MKRNRLKITMESRIHGDVYVRFGGERLETYRPKGRQGALRLACGTGIYHSEMNGSDTEPAEFLQIWVIPEKLNTPPAYQDYDIRPYLHKNKLSLIVSPDGNAPAGMLQQAWFSIGEVEAGKKLGYHLHQSHAGVYIFLIEGEIKVDGTVLSRRDGMGVYETDSFELETLQDSHILLIEVPM